MQSTWPIFFQRVLKSEGTEFEDVPGDNGGPTCCGITIFDVARWHGIKVPSSLKSLRQHKSYPTLRKMVRDLTPETAQPIYKSFYWDACRADELPAGLDYAVVDYAVNSGLGRAVPLLADLAGVPGKTVSDDLIDALRSLDTHALIVSYCEHRERFLRSIGAKPTQRKFLKGWLARVDRVQAEALEIARAPQTQAAPTTSGVPTVPELGGKVRTASRSWTVWSTIGIVLTYLEEQFNFLVGLLPDVTAGVDSVLAPLGSLAGHLGLNGVGVRISTVIVLVLACVVVYRHTRDKHQLLKGTAT